MKLELLQIKLDLFRDKRINLFCFTLFLYRHKNSYNMKSSSVWIKSICERSRFYEFVCLQKHIWFEYLTDSSWWKAWWYFNDETENVRLEIFTNYGIPQLRKPGELKPVQPSFKSSAESSNNKSNNISSSTCRSIISWKLPALIRSLIW